MGEEAEAELAALQAIFPERYAAAEGAVGCSIGVGRGATLEARWGAGGWGLEMAGGSERLAARLAAWRTARDPREAILFEAVEWAEREMAQEAEEARAEQTREEKTARKEAARKQHQSDRAQKRAQEKSRGGGGGTGSAGGHKGGARGGGGGGGKKAGAKSDAGGHGKNPHKTKSKPKSAPSLPNAIMTPEQEDSLAAVLLNESEADGGPTDGNPLVLGSIVSGTSDRRTMTRLEKVYTRLQGAGVTHDLIVKGMTTVLGGSYDAVVDWLLLHVPREQLPATLGGDVVEDVPSNDNGGSKGSGKSGGGGGGGGAVKLEDLREYDFGTWKGKYPKSMMHEWCQKKQCSRPAYNRARHKGAGVRFKVTIKVEGNKLPDHKKGSVITIECPEACASDVPAQHLAATYALYSLNKTLSLHTMMPPDYRAAWDRWVAEDKQQKVAAQESKSKPKREFLAELFDKISAARASLGHMSPMDFKSGAAIGGGVSGGRNDNNAPKMNLSNVAYKPDAPSKAMRQASAALQAWWGKRVKESNYQKMLRARASLPITDYRDKILRQIRNNQVTCLSGATGCGKSTQLPQFLLEDALSGDQASETHIVCTQPRRISAQSIAGRVSDEMGEPDVGGLVGYRVRLESKSSRKTQLLYVTTGVLLRRLQNDPLLSGTTHLVIDEVHERSLDTDFALIILLDLLPRRPDLRLVLMSATADVGLFSSYFGGCNVVDVPGRTFPCRHYFVEDLVKMTGYRIEEDSEYALEDPYASQEVDVSIKSKGIKEMERLEYETHQESKVIAGFLDQDEYDLGVRRTIHTMDHMCINQELIEEILLMLERAEPFSKTDGAVLLFLPSLAEISSLLYRLEEHPILGDDRRFVLVPLHGVLAGKDQRKAFDSAPRGKRKIVLATNIAETGITIPDVVFVIDAGFENSLRYNPSTRIAALKTVRISQASSKQRAGRAGRVQEGFAFKLYTKQCFEEEMEEQTRPEMQRQPLESMCLKILDMNWEPYSFLQRALSPPSTGAVEASMKILSEVGALSEDHKSLSPLGQLLAQLPLEPFVAKMLIFAAIFRCLTPVSVMAAATMCQSPFHRPVGHEQSSDKARREYSIKGSDHFALYKAYRAWAEARKGRGAWQWCRSHYVDNQRMETIHKSAQDLRNTVENVFGARKKKAGSELNLDANSNYAEVIKVSLAAGMYPRVAWIGEDGLLRYGRKAKKVDIHPSSCNTRPKELNTYYLYQEVFKSSFGKVYLKETTMVGSLPLLLFSNQCSASADGVIQLDGALTVRGVTARQVAIVRALRAHLSSLLEDPQSSALFSSKPLHEFESLLKQKSKKST